MDQPDIISMVVEELYQLHLVDEACPRLARYATISRSWNSVVERRVFESKLLNSGEIPTLKEVYKKPHRRAILRTIDYHIKLRTYGLTDDEKEQNNRTFLSGLSDLLQTLSLWEEHGLFGEGHGVLQALEIRVGGWFDVDHEVLGLPPAPSTYLQRARESQPQHHFNFDQDQMAQLPTVRRVTQFTPYGFRGTSMHPTLVFKIARRFPRLEALSIAIQYPDMRWREQREELRNALADGLLGLRDAATQMKILKIKFDGMTDPWNHDFKAQNFEKELDPTCEQSQRVDRFCEAVRLLTQTDGFRELELDGAIVSRDLFRDRRLPDETGDTTSWPTLQAFKVVAGILAPSGLWYYTGTRRGAIEDGSDITIGPNRRKKASVLNGEAPQKSWRSFPNMETFGPLVIDLTDAVQRMPRLDAGILTMAPDTRRNIVHLQYASAHCKLPLQAEGGEWGDALNENGRRWRMTMQCSPKKWALPNTIIEKWERWVGSGLVVVEVVKDDGSGVETLYP